MKPSIIGIVSILSLILFTGCSETYYVDSVDDSSQNIPHNSLLGTASTEQPEFEDGLPVVYLSSKPTKDWHPATFYYKGRKYSVEAKLRGATSLKYPQNSYTIKFSDGNRFTDAENNFKKRKKIVLTNTFDDNSYIRQRLAFDMWCRLDLRHIQIKTFSCILYINNEYYGLYTLGDHVDKHHIKNNDLKNSGDLYKTVSLSANMTEKEDLLDGFEKKSGSTSDDHLKSLILTASRSKHVSDTLKKLIHHHEFENVWMLITLISAFDTQVKNLYYYRVPLDRWKIIPWDFNASFGQDWRTKRVASDNQALFCSNSIFKLFVNDTTNFNLLKRRMNYELTEGRLTLEWVLDKIDSYYSEIREAALKSQQRWKKEYRSFNSWKSREDFTSFEEEIEYIKTWISDRYRYLDSKLLDK